MRLIDADILRFYLNTRFFHDVRDKGMVCETINAQPTIESVKKGKWIIYTLSMFDGEDCKCSECGQISCAPYWNFCPNCGAKMEKSEDIPMEYFENGGM